MTADFKKYREWLLYHRCYSRLRELAPGEHTESLIKVRERQESMRRQSSEESFLRYFIRERSRMSRRKYLLLLDRSGIINAWQRNGKTHMLWRSDEKAV